MNPSFPPPNGPEKVALLYTKRGPETYNARLLISSPIITFFTSPGLAGSIKNFNPVLEGHPHLDLLNGVHWTTGSEGHGFPAGLGMAFAKKKKKEPGLVYVLMGDGECQEGTTWESLLLASHLKLDNLVIIIDYNKIQGSGYVEDILPMESVLTLAKSLNWEVKEVNGHDLDDIENTIKNMNESNKPKFVFAHTVKGKGVSYMENEPAWHAKWPDPEHEKIAIEELSK